MRRLASVLVGLGLAAGIAIVPAVAASATTTSAQLNSEVTGPFSGTSTINVGSSCSQIQQFFEATFTTTTSTGAGSFSIDGCVTLVFPVTPFSGSFTLTAPDGATLQGAAAGTVTQTSNPTIGTVSLTLTPTSGTNEFANVTGVINLTGTWTSSEALGVPGPFSGSVSGALNPGSGLPTTTSLSSSTNPSVVGQPVTYTATVSPTPSGGTVAFTDNGSPIAGCSAVTLSGASASCSDTPGATGANNIVATYSGSGNFLGSASPVLTQVVTTVPPPPQIPCKKLAGCNLSGLNLSNASLSGDDLQGANLLGANLSGADLSWANLQSDNLMGANLSGANLSGANLKGANLDNVTWGNTTCPDGTNSNNDGGTCVGHL